MKNSNLLLLILALTVGCSKKKDYPSLFGQLERKGASKEKLLQRELAANPAGKCLSDVFSVNLLRAEIRELEKKYSSGTKVRGTWKHLDLSKLPIPQATFLKKFGDRIGDQVNPEAHDFSACSDVPCVFNTIYETEEGPAGYVHYIWYLRMGSLLNVTNKIHDATEKPGIYNEKKHPMSAYLFRDNEIFAFWKLSQMLKAPFTNLPKLEEIQRVPQGEEFDFVYQENKNKAEEEDKYVTCGQAFSEGFIVLQDRCLQLDPTGEAGVFYNDVLHEITHHLDYHQGELIGKDYRSLEPDYLKLSNFLKKEYKDENGVTKISYTLLPNTMAVSKYAKESPQETFAETLSLFRVKAPLTAKNISPEHFAFTSNNYYDGTNFVPKALVRRWISEESSSISQLAFRAVSDCAQSATPQASTFFQSSDFKTNITPSMLSCLGAKASEISLELQSKIRISDPDGCSNLVDVVVEKIWDPSLKVQLAGLMDKHLEELKKDQAYFSRISKFVDTISDRKIANAAYLSCSEMSDEKKCYDGAVLRLALEDLAALKLPEAHAQELAQMYLEAHDLNDTMIYFDTYYKTFVSSHTEIIDAEAEELYSRCEALPTDDTQPPTGKNISVGSGYMVSSLYNCLNSEFPAAAKSVVRSLDVDGLKVRHPKEEVLLYKKVVPELKKSVEASYQKKKAEEAARISETLSEDRDGISKVALKDFDWVKDAFSSEKMRKDCQDLLLSKLSSSLRYHTKMEAFGEHTAALCRSVEDSPEYTKWLKNSETSFTSKSQSTLEGLVLEYAHEEARTCSETYPLNSSLNRSKNKDKWKSCLLRSWPALEAKAVEKFSGDPVVKKFDIDVSGSKTKLATRRRALQLRIIEEYN